MRDPRLAGHACRLATAEDLEKLLSLVGVNNLFMPRDSRRCVVQVDSDENLIGCSSADIGPLVHLSEGFHYSLPENTAFLTPLAVSEKESPLFRWARDWAALQALGSEGRSRVMTIVPTRELNDFLVAVAAAYAVVGEYWVRRDGRSLRFGVDVPEDLWCIRRRL